MTSNRQAVGMGVNQWSVVQDGEKDIELEPKEESSPLDMTQPLSSCVSLG